jgi:hypothetical protein
MSGTVCAAPISGSREGTTFATQTELYRSTGLGASWPERVVNGAADLGGVSPDRGARLQRPRLPTRPRRIHPCLYLVDCDADSAQDGSA